MIEQRQIVPLLLEACPSFAPSWDEHVAEYGEDLLYVAAGAWARHLLQVRTLNEPGPVLAVAELVERLLLEGTPWVKEFATIGLLESVQNVWENEGADPEWFAAFLGPEGRRWWSGLNKFWSGEAPHVRAEG